MNQRIKELAFWIMIILVIALGIYLVHWTKTESFQCLSNPYIYSIKLLEEANQAEVTCLCTPQKFGGLSVLLTRDGFSKIDNGYLLNGLKV